MKHIGWCLDSIQRAVMKRPMKLDSQEDKKRANSMLDEIQEYVNTLAQLVLNPNFKKYLYQLEKTPIKGVSLQAHQIEELFKDLEHVLYVLSLYIKNLRNIIITHPEQWVSKSEQLVRMIDQKFGGEKGELRREFQIVLHSEEELRRIITSEKHLAEFLK